jgi:hypothetical protein
VAALVLATLVYSERFRKWTRSLRQPTPILAEAWVERLTAPPRFVLHLGLVNPGETPIATTRVAVKLSIYPFDLSVPNRQLRIADRALIAPHSCGSLELELSIDHPDFLEMAIDYLEPAARGLAIEFISGEQRRVLAWEVPKLGDAAHHLVDSETEILPAARSATPDRLGWLPWRL